MSAPPEDPLEPSTVTCTESPCKSFSYSYTSDNRILTSTGINLKTTSAFSLDVSHSLLDSSWVLPLIILLCFLVHKKIQDLRNNSYFLGLTQDHINRIRQGREEETREVDLNLVRTTFTVNNEEAKPSNVSEEEATSADDENFCPICYQDFTLPVKSNCSHIFCSNCIILCWKTTESRGGGHTTLSRLRCPMCREMVDKLKVIYEVNPDLMSEAELAGNLPSGENGSGSFENGSGNGGSGRSSSNPETKYILQWRKEIENYNTRFSKDGSSQQHSITSIITLIKDIPLAIKHMWCEMTGETGVLMFCKLQVILAVIFGFIYLIIPFDYIPEKYYGIIGMIDDVFIGLCVFVYFSFLYRNIILERED